MHFLGLQEAILLALFLSRVGVHPAGAASKQQQQQQSVMTKRIGNSTFTCSSLFLMLHKADGTLEKLRDYSARIGSQVNVTEEEKVKARVLELYQRELRAALTTLETVLKDLNQTVSGDYHSLDKLKKSCRVRLQDMRGAAVIVEEDHNAILELEKLLFQQNTSSNSRSDHSSYINELLREISNAADDLEKKLVEDIFSDMQKVEGAALETVVKLPERTGSNGRAQRGEGEDMDLAKNHLPEDQAVSVLVDSVSNVYVLSRPRDVTLLMEDRNFFEDMVCLLLLSFVLGALCSLVRVPALFGYTFAGMLLGPVGYNVVRSVIQVETLGEVGVVFIMFVIGLRFSLEKLRRVWRISIYGANLFLGSSVGVGVVLGVLLGVDPKHSLYVSACLCLSSSSLATRFLEGSQLTESKHSSRSISAMEISSSPDHDIAESLVGVLVMQDMQLGMLMALMPFFAGLDHRSSSGPPPSSSSGALPEGLKVLAGFCFVFALTWLLSTRLLGWVQRILEIVRNRAEIFLLYSVAVCAFLTMTSNWLGVPVEVGCFLAGLAVNAQSTQVIKQVTKVVVPLRDFFSIFFFASIGFHVFPSFMMSEFSMIFAITLCVVVLKVFLSMSTLSVCVGRLDTPMWVVAVGLAHVSEFSFVLASRARRLLIVSREVYLMILSVAALSMLLAPLLWQLTLISAYPTSSFSLCKLFRAPLTFVLRTASKLRRQ